MYIPGITLDAVIIQTSKLKYLPLDYEKATCSSPVRSVVPRCHTAVTTKPSCLWIQRGKWSQYAKAPWKQKLQQLFRALLWLAPTAVGERWERNKWNLMHVFSKQNRDRSAICPSNPLNPQSHLPCPHQHPASSLLRLTCKVSFYCRVNSSNHAKYPGLVQPEQTQQTALHPGLSGRCTSNRINCREKKISPDSNLFSLLHPASTNKPHSWTVHSSSLCASGCT